MWGVTLLSIIRSYIWAFFCVCACVFSFVLPVITVSWRWTVVDKRVLFHCESQQEPHTLLCFDFQSQFVSVCTCIFRLNGTGQLRYTTCPLSPCQLRLFLMFFWKTFLNRSVICRQVSVSKNMMCLFMVEFCFFFPACVWQSVVACQGSRLEPGKDNSHTHDTTFSPSFNSTDQIKQSVFSDSFKSLS